MRATDHDETPLFEGYEPTTPCSTFSSAGQRRTLRQAEAISNGRHPLTGGPLHDLATRERDASSPKSDPFTCGSCYFRETARWHDQTYPKCSHGEGSRITHGPASDVRAWWPACRDYVPGDPALSPDAARWIPTEAES